eukprot:364472-Chlamydomonas_euryale.AAC.5
MPPAAALFLDPLPNARRLDPAAVAALPPTAEHRVAQPVGKTAQQGCSARQRSSGCSASVLCGCPSPECGASPRWWCG